MTDSIQKYIIISFSYTVLCIGSRVYQDCHTPVHSHDCQLTATTVSAHHILGIDLYSGANNLQNMYIHHKKLYVTTTQVSCILVMFVG